MDKFGVKTINQNYKTFDILPQKYKSQNNITIE
jgi:hypothetical protein